MDKIYIVVRGGFVQDVFGTNLDTEVYILDKDSDWNPAIQKEIDDGMDDGSLLVLN